MGVNHRRLDIGMAQQFLHGPDILAILQKMGRERMPKGMGGRAFFQLGTADCGREFAHHRSFMIVVPALVASARVERELARRKEVLPDPRSRGCG